MHERPGPDSSRPGRLWPLLWLVWLPFLGIPLAALVQAHPAPLRLGAVLAAAAHVVATYLRVAWRTVLRHGAYPASAPQGPAIWRWGPVAVLAGLSVALVLGDGSRWLELLIFTSASVGVWRARAASPQLSWSRKE
jgi:hypothetical protein